VNGSRSGRGFLPQIQSGCSCRHWVDKNANRNSNWINLE